MPHTPTSHSSWPAHQPCFRRSPPEKCYRLSEEVQPGRNDVTIPRTSSPKRCLSTLEHHLPQNNRERHWKCQTKNSFLKIEACEFALTVFVAKISVKSRFAARNRKKPFARWWSEVAYTRMLLALKKIGVWALRLIFLKGTFWTVNRAFKNGAGHGFNSGAAMLYNMKAPLLNSRTVRAQNAKSHLVIHKVATQNRGGGEIVFLLFSLSISTSNFGPVSAPMNLKSGPVFEASSCHICQRPHKMDPFLYILMYTMTNYTIKPRIFLDLRISEETLLRTVQEMVVGNVQQNPSCQAPKIWNHLAKEEEKTK